MTLEILICTLPSVQVSCHEGEHFGRFAVLDVGVRVPLQVTVDVHAEDALNAAD